MRVEGHEQLSALIEALGLFLSLDLARNGQLFAEQQVEAQHEGKELCADRVIKRRGSMPRQAVEEVEDVVAGDLIFSRKENPSRSAESGRRPAKKNLGRRC